MIWGEEFLFGKPITRDNARELVDKFNAIGVKNWDDVELEQVPELTPFFQWSACPDQEYVRYGSTEVRLVGRIIAKAESIESATDLVYEGAVNHTIPDNAGDMELSDDELALVHGGKGSDARRQVSSLSIQQRMNFGRRSFRR